MGDVIRMVSPDIGLPEIAVGEEQLEYRSLTAAVVEFDDGSSGLVTRWKPTQEERARIAAGEDFYVTLLTCGHPMQPMAVDVGPPDFARSTNKD